MIPQTRNLGGNHLVVVLCCICCATFIWYFNYFYATTAILVLVAHIGRNHKMASEVIIIMFIRRKRHGRSIYMFYVICRDCVNMLKIGGYASCAREQAGNMSGNSYLSIGGVRGHTAAILGEVRMRVKMVQKCS